MELFDQTGVLVRVVDLICSVYTATRAILPFFRLGQLLNAILIVCPAVELLFLYLMFYYVF